MSLFFIHPQDSTSIDIQTLEKDQSENTFLSSNVFLPNDEAFQSEGRRTAQIFTEAQMAELFAAIEAIVYKDLLTFQPGVTDFDLHDYHHIVADDTIHRSISKWGIQTHEIAEFYRIAQARMEEILGIDLMTKTITHNGKPGQYIGYRLVRPGREDHNPFHRDSWIEYWQDTINVWLPLSGFDGQNGLQFIEQSHLFDNEGIYRTRSGYVSGGKTYHVPAAMAFDHPFTIVRPALRSGEGIIFSPYLIHGNGVNSSQNETRVSLEFRFSPRR